MTCTDCDQPATRSLGFYDYCTAHHEQILDTLDPAVFGPIGQGRAIATTDGGWWTLACRHCAATWVGTPGEACRWCARAHQVMLDHQAELVLSPPDVNPSDINHDARIMAWAERLAVAARAGVVDPQTARRALERHRTRHAAA